jgi:hypothetical protein
MTEQDSLRLRRAGGPGSPGSIQSDWMQNSRNKETSDTAADSVNLKKETETIMPAEKLSRIKNTQLPFSIEEKISEDKPEEMPGPVLPEKLYNIELIIYTISGHKYSARMNFKDDAERGRIKTEDAKRMIARVENDLRNRTFQRPITYSENKGSGAAVEYIFNPENVECIAITRHY